MAAAPDPAAHGDLVEVVWARLGPQADDDPATLGGLEALRVLRRRRARRRRRDLEALDPDVAPLLQLIAAEPGDLPDLPPELVAFLERGRAGAVERAAVPEIFQAYVRAVGRVASAEADVARQAVAAAPPDERVAVLEQAIDDLLVLGAHGFELLHRMLLLDVLSYAVEGLDRAEEDGGRLAIGMVDLVRSTQHLLETDHGDVEQLVDALFEAGQLATAHRAASVVKYVGDGLFLSGRDVAEVADTALEVIGRLEAELPLRARGGLDFGPVIRRAGDLFGLPINTATIVTKAARPGRLLATAQAAARLPTSRRGRYRDVELPHPALGRTRVATVRAAPAPG